MGYPKGTRVVVVKLTPGFYNYQASFRDLFIMRGKKLPGVVLGPGHNDFSQWLSVQFNESFGGHDCGGLGKIGHCQYVNPVDVVLEESDEI